MRDRRGVCGFMQGGHAWFYAGGVHDRGACMTEGGCA